MSNGNMSSKSSEIEQVSAACRTLIDYLSEQGYLAQPAAFLEALEGARAARSIRALKAALSDLTQRSRAMSPEQRKELEKRLAPVGPGVLEQENRLIADPLIRGRIETEDEYRAILARVEEIHSSPAHEEEVTRMNELLAEAHSRELR